MIFFHATNKMLHTMNRTLSYPLIVLLSCCLPLLLQAQPEPDCTIENIDVEIQPCTPNNIFYVHLLFDVENPGPEGFSVFGNGQSYGSFEYGEFFYNIGPFESNANGLYELIIVDNTDDNCSGEITFGPVDCTNNCGLANLIAYPISCTGNDGLFDLFVDVDDSNAAGNTLGLYLDGQLYETFAATSFPLLLEDVQATSTQIEVKVCADNALSCCLETTLTVLDTMTFACTANCIDFEELTVGDTYGEANGDMPGDTILVDEDVAITLENFFYFDGSFDFVSAFVTEGFFGTPIDDWGTSISPGNINLQFDFNGVYGTVTNVCFDFFDGGGEVNFAVNGSTLQVLNDFPELDLSLLPDNIQVDINLTSNPSNFPTGTICVTGPVETLTVGGQEFTMDNVCYNTEVPDCEVTEFIVEPYDCEDGEFMIDVVFQTSAPGNEGFSISVNNQVNSGHLTIRIML
jgi:hypothetical protein